jgi:hypothetical protein
MAPVAGGIADGKENGFILGFCLIKSFVAPRVPVHGIMRVLEEVGGFFVY